MRCRFCLLLCLIGSVKGWAGAMPDSLQRYTFSHPQMGTVFRLVMYAESAAKAQNAAAEVFALVDSLNACMSDYLPDSELSQLCNTAGSGKPVRVSDHLWKVLRQAKSFSKKSQGAFDATIGPLTRLWRRARSLKEIPDSARIEEAKSLVDWRNMVFQKGQQVELLKTGMRLDLGGIAQGYAADRCLEMLKRHGIQSALVDAGGDIALGAAPPGQPGWQVEVPGEEGKQGHTRTLHHCGITTSGATYRYLEVNGVRYAHIVDPRSGWGLTHRVLVTVQAPNATTADAWATAISVLGASGWEKLKHKPRRLRVWLTENNL